jgi:D-beta-D-heptose 7-phosphate kinase/D-beta-D-heptose 1-phosphate adenosyltransferase
MKSSIETFRDTRILVIGDVMLDRYWWGMVNRISPEGPVPVVKIRDRSSVPGGAGNVAANLVGLGCGVSLLGARGDDDAGTALEALLDRKGIDATLVIRDDASTTTKTRVMARDQQLLRLDEEDIGPASPTLTDRIMAIVSRDIHRYHALILSDYGKGLLGSTDICRKLIDLGDANGIPVLVDPKSRNWKRYRGATCITPNLAELQLVVDHSIENDDAALAETAETMRQQCDLDFLLVTLGARGMLLSSREEKAVLPTVAQEVYDVSGAGDTVIATLAAGLAVGMTPCNAAAVANIAAGIVVGKLGTQPITHAELDHAWRQAPGAASDTTGGFEADAAHMQLNAWRSAGQRVVFTNGCFDLLHPGHISLLHQARRLGDRLIVGLNTDASVKRLKGNSRPVLNEQDRAVMLNALACVDMVVLFDEDTPENLICKLKPDVLVKGADYKPEEVVGKNIVESYGGEVKLVNLLEGYSTTGITEKIKPGGPPG